MTSTSTHKQKLLTRVAAHLNRNRLGDLLTASGVINDTQLNEALKLQKVTGSALGEVLREQGLITKGTLRATLMQQIAWRALAACCVFAIGFSTMGLSMSRATSATLNGDNTRVSQRSLPEDADNNVVPASINQGVTVANPNRYPSLFGTSETRSADISPFTKWTAISARLNSKSAALPAALAAEAGSSQSDKIEAVNAYFNKTRYIEDKNNWGSSDYWATPAEFASRGGDCEDYAIAKYAALKDLGFTESQMRLAIVQDTWKGIPHAILIVYSDDGVKFLDNQYKTVKDADGFTRYRPVYSINRTGWWRHAG